MSGLHVPGITNPSVHEKKGFSKSKFSFIFWGNISRPFRAYKKVGFVGGQGVLKSKRLEQERTGRLDKKIYANGGRSYRGTSDQILRESKATGRIDGRITTNKIKKKSNTFTLYLFQLSWG